MKLEFSLGDKFDLVHKGEVLGSLDIVVCGFDEEGNLVHLFGGNNSEDVKKTAENFPYDRKLVYLTNRPEIIRDVMMRLGAKESKVTLNRSKVAEAYYGSRIQGNYGPMC